MKRSKYFIIGFLVITLTYVLIDESVYDMNNPVSDMTKEIEISNSTDTNKIFVFPFRVFFDPMKYVLIADFKDDDEFEGMEPQLFNDSINGKGLRVIVYRKDKKIDVYWEKGVKPFTEAYTLGAGLGTLKEIVFESNTFEINKKGVLVDVRFTDKQGRAIKLCLEEKSNKNGYQFLAPIGSAIKEPKQLFMAYLHDFRFVSRANSTCNIHINNRKVSLTKSPIPSFTKEYFTKYASDISIGVINPPTDKPIAFSLTNRNAYYHEGMKMEFDNNQLIKSIISSYKEKNIEMSFPNGFPNLMDLKNRKKYTGRWIVKISNDFMTGGYFELKRNVDMVDITLLVNKKWQPKNSTIWTYIIPFFRNWPTTYQWSSTVDLKNLTMDGHWIRK